MKRPFIHLRARSDYSLLEGALQIKKLGALCSASKQPALALTDTNNLFGALEFASTLAAAGIQPITGTTFILPDESQLVLLAKNEEGYHNLMKLSSQAYHRQNTRRGVHLEQEDMKELSAGLICLTGGTRGLLNCRLDSNRAAEAATLLEQLAHQFEDRLYVELHRHGYEQWSAQQKETEAWLVEQAAAYQLGLVATNDVYFPTRDDFESHDVLLCIAQGRKIAEEFPRTITRDHYFKTSEEMAALFSDLPEAIENTAEIAQRCSFFPQEQKPVLPRFSQGEEKEDKVLEKLAQQGLDERFAALEQQKATVASREVYQQRLDKELSMITSMGFAGYFLIVADFVGWALKQDIPVGPGRGSGAGSLVAYALKITNLDPLRFGLIFERFLNPERVSMPDFDIDFCQERRDEVFRYVRERYGEDRVANIITFGTLKARAVLRDVGRVLGMPYGQVDRLAKLVPNNPSAPMTLSKAIDAEPALQDARKEDAHVARLLDISLRLEGLNRHASAHAAGVVIGNRPLNELIPIAKDAAGATITQFSMKWVEQAGLVKFDLLGLKTLTALQRTCQLLAKRGVEIDLGTIPLDDKPTYDLLTSGQTSGIFQMESGGMRDVLRDVQPDRIEDLIALISLYRPGPMENIPQYVRRKKGEEEPDTIHPMLEPVLKETFGVVIYQEQVMQIARVLAGYSDAEADSLRRAMGKKITKEMNEHRSQFVKGAEAKGVERKTAQHIFDLVAKFAGYGFNKSHAAAYALLTYQTAWLKRHYSTEFLAALMTLEINNTDKIAQFKQEAYRLDVEVLPPDVNYSEDIFTVVDGKIFHALAAMRDVGLEAARHFVALRAEQGAMNDIFTFAKTCAASGLNKKAIESLACAGVFDSIHPNRRQIFEHASLLASLGRQEQEGGQENLFGNNDDAQTILPQCEDWNEEERLANEFKAVGMYLSAHPLEPWHDKLIEFGVRAYADFCEDNKTMGRLVGVITAVQERRSRRGTPYAFITLSDLSGSYEVVVFAELLRMVRALLVPGTLVMLEVEADRAGEQTRLQAQSIKKLDGNLKVAGVRKQMLLRLLVPRLDSLPAIKETLEANPGNTRVHLVLSNDTEVALPEGVVVNSQMVERLNAMGVDVQGA